MKVLLFRGGGCYATMVWECIYKQYSDFPIKKIVYDDGEHVHRAFANDWAHVRTEQQLLEELAGVEDIDIDAYLCFGSSSLRKKTFEQLETLLTSANLKYSFPRAIHEKSTLASTVTVGQGTYIGVHVSVAPYAEVGSFCLLNTGSIVGHDGILEDFVNLNPGSVLCGNSHIKSEASIGANAAVREKLTVAQGAFLGMGAVLTKNLEEPGSVLVGNPAKPLIKK